MGYDIQLIGADGEPVQVKRHGGGGTFVLGGSTNADISITYNYSRFYYDTIDEDEGIRWIYNKTGETCIPRLHSAVRELGTTESDDYWLSTPGNAGHILNILLGWAKANPTAVFQGD